MAAPLPPSASASSVDCMPKTRAKPRRLMSTGSRLVGWAVMPALEDSAVRSTQ